MVTHVPSPTPSPSPSVHQNCPGFCNASVSTQSVALFAIPEPIQAKIAEPVVFVDPYVSLSISIQHNSLPSQLLSSPFAGVSTAHGLTKALASLQSDPVAVNSAAIYLFVGLRHCVNDPVAVVQ